MIVSKEHICKIYAKYITTNIGRITNQEGPVRVDRADDMGNVHGSSHLRYWQMWLLVVGKSLARFCLWFRPGSDWWRCLEPEKGSLPPFSSGCLWLGLLALDFWGEPMPIPHGTGRAHVCAPKWHNQSLNFLWPFFAFSECSRFGLVWLFSSCSFLKSNCLPSSGFLMKQTEFTGSE